MKLEKWKFEHWHVIAGFLIAYDIFAVNFAYFIALWLRFDGKVSAIPHDYNLAWTSMVPAYSVICLLVFGVLRLYKSIWRFASIVELERVVLACLVTCCAHTVLITSFFRRMPVSYYIFGFILQLILVLGIRFSYRLALALRNIKRFVTNKGENVMLVGAGSAGQMILRDFQKSQKLGGKHVVCIIDDNPNKWKRYIDGVPVVGGRESIPYAVEKYNIKYIYVALPSASAEQRREILEICKDTGCEMKNLPGMYQLVQGDIAISAMRDVSVEDLLGRDPIRADLEEVFRFITGKIVLVTGGGGSIGSELCRQIAMHEPAKLIVFDIYENNAYEVQTELRKEHPDLDLQVQIGSVRDKERVMSLFETYRPQLVFHAAAHKHVPLMEESTHDAVKNNIFGTRNVALAADRYKAEKMVLISTDKAVRPTNVMGATKRVCEMIIQCMAQRSETVFTGVRFGNVLGSSGSVIPIFRRQIADGGPVTVTHPDIIRYFMTIPEAVRLVLQCGALAQGGEIFLLDMGEPVRILNLAENMIRLSGLKPYEDIDIVFTGLRPGEKLYEELLIDEDNIKKTSKEGIFVATLPMVDVEVLHTQLAEMKHLLEDSGSDVRCLLQEIVPEYKIWKKSEEVQQ